LLAWSRSAFPAGTVPTSWFPSRNQLPGSASSKLRPTIVAKRTVHTRGTAVTSYPPPPTAIHRPPQSSDESPPRIRPTAAYVPGVRVDVDVQDPPDPVLIEQGPDPDCDVVEDAEAGRTVGHRMVKPAAEVEGPCAASRRHLRTSPQGCTHLEGRCLVHPCEYGIVDRPETMGLRGTVGIRPELLYLGHVLRPVNGE